MKSSSFAVTGLTALVLTLFPRGVAADGGAPAKPLPNPQGDKYACTGWDYKKIPGGTRFKFGKFSSEDVKRGTIKLFEGEEQLILQAKTRLSCTLRSTNPTDDLLELLKKNKSFELVKTERTDQEHTALRDGVSRVSKTQYTDFTIRSEKGHALIVHCIFSLDEPAEKVDRLQEQMEVTVSRLQGALSPGATLGLRTVSTDACKNRTRDWSQPELAAEYAGELSRLRQSNANRQPKEGPSWIGILPKPLTAEDDAAGAR